MKNSMSGIGPMDKQAPPFAGGNFTQETSNIVGSGMQAKGAMKAAKKNKKKSK